MLYSSLLLDWSPCRVVTVAARSTMDMVHQYTQFVLDNTGSQCSCWSNWSDVFRAWNSSDETCCWILDEPERSNGWLPLVNQHKTGDTIRWVTSRPTVHLIWWHRHRWKKHVLVSSSTIRLRSSDDIFCRLACIANHTSSVLGAFNWSCRLAHQLQMSLIHWIRRWRAASTSDIRTDRYICLSSAYKYQVVVDAVTL